MARTGNQCRGRPAGLPLGLENLRQEGADRHEGGGRPRPRQARGPAGVRLRRRRLGRDDPGPPRRDLLHHGAVGQRQVDADPHAQPPDRADERRDLRQGPGALRAERHRAPRDAGAPHRDGVPERRAAAEPDRARERRLRPRGAGRRQGRAQPRRRGVARRRSASATGCSATRASSRAACSSASASPAR